MSLRKLAGTTLRQGRKSLHRWQARWRGETVWENYDRLFQRDIAPQLRSLTPAKPARRILFWSPLAPWNHTLIERFLSVNLRLRGHEVITAWCDGGQPHCFMEREKWAKRDCLVCSAHARYVLGIFGGQLRKLSEFISPAQQQHMAAECAAMPGEILRDFTDSGIALGAQAARYLTSYYSGFVPFESHVATAQRVLAGERLFTHYAGQLAAEVRPDLVVMFSGNDASYHGPFRRLRQMGIPVVTWDESPQWKDGFYFAHDTLAGDVPLAELWPTAANQALTPPQEQELTAYLEDWSTGRASAINYHPNRESDANRLRERLGVPTDKPVLAAFTNVVWDSNVLTKNVGFRDMREWVAVLVDWFAAHPERFLVLRAHPGESKIPQEAFKTRPDSTLPALVRSLRPTGLPANVRVIPAEDDADSYVLGQMASAVAVYTTNIGFELALRGKQVWVGGLAIYRGKGFTCDLESPAHLCQMLDRGDWAALLPPEQLALARRFLHFWVFRYVVRLPWHRRPHANLYAEVRFKDFAFLRPGGDPQLDALADCVLEGRSFVDIPKRSGAEWRVGQETRWQTSADQP